MKTASSLTKEEFDDLLAWLNSDPACAGESYEGIRSRLIKFFLNRQCSEAEDLADETINRVAKKSREWKANYEGERARYFHAVAKKVLLEHWRERNRKVQVPTSPSRAELEPYLVCLDDCLAQLPSENRELILPYYQERKRAKITSHRALVNKMKLKPGALRARIHRIRTKLRACVEECVRNLPQSNNINSAGI